MTFDEFIKNYEYKKIDFDKAYGFQCVDLFRLYQKEVLTIPIHTGAVQGAKDLYNNFDKMPKMKDYYNKIYTPQKGDIVVWGGSKFGHVAIVIYATPKTIIVFEQDGYKQDGAKIALRDYENVLGFLRRKK